MGKLYVYTCISKSQNRIKTAVLDKSRTEIERKQRAHDDWDSSSGDENGGRSF